MKIILSKQEVRWKNSKRPNNNKNKNRNKRYTKQKNKVRQKESVQIFSIIIVNVNLLDFPKERTKSLYLITNSNYYSYKRNAFKKKT